MKTLLTGDEGYVGSGLTRYLKQAHEVIGWKNQKDVRTLKSIIKELGIDAVVNCAAVTDRVTPLFKIDYPTEAVTRYFHSGQGS
jgi:dTDP-4-dehydrorhamnose reductase